MGPSAAVFAELGPHLEVRGASSARRARSATGPDESQNSWTSAAVCSPIWAKHVVAAAVSDYRPHRKGASSHPDHQAPHRKSRRDDNFGGGPQQSSRRRGVTNWRGLVAPGPFILEREPRCGVLIG